MTRLGFKQTALQLVVFASIITFILIYLFSSQIIYEGPDPVTGLGFKQTALQLVVFVSTRHHVLSFTLSNKGGDKPHKEILDEHGCKPKCAAITDAVLENQFVIARSVLGTIKLKSAPKVKSRT